MSISELYTTLQEHGIDINMIRFNDASADDVFCIIENYGSYMVGYRERGILYDTKTFLTLDEVQQYLLRALALPTNCIGTK